MVELEAQRQQDATLQHARRHAGIANGTEQDGVVAAQLLEHRGGQRLAGAVVQTGAQVVLLGGDGHVALYGVEDLEGLGHHLGADAVAGDEGQVEGARHGAKASGAVAASGREVAPEGLAHDGAGRGTLGLDACLEVGVEVRVEPDLDDT